MLGEFSLIPLVQSADRALISQFINPKPLQYQYFSLYQKTLHSEKFNENFLNVVSSLQDPSTEEVYENLANYVITQIEFSKDDYDGRLAELASLIRTWTVDFFKSKGITLSPFHCQASSFASPPLKLLKKVTGIVCSDYAFLQLGEERAQQTFFSEFSPEDSSLPILKVWGYKVVDKPRPGDLVVYFDKQKEVHYGIWNQNLKVVSKWGSGEVYEHPLELLLEDYGTHVLFLRKPIFQDILEELQTWSESGMQAEELKQFAQELIKNKLEKCHNRSFAFNFFTEWSEKILGCETDSFTLEECLVHFTDLAEEIPFQISI